MKKTILFLALSVLISCSGDSESPIYNIPVPTTASEHFKSAYPGVGVTLAIQEDGTLWGCGSHSAVGLLGNDTASSDLVLPAQIGTANDWKLVNVDGIMFAMAIKNDGSLWAWGRTEGMTTGINTTIPLLVPTRVGTDNDWKTLECSPSYTIALKNNGTMWGVGNSYSFGVGISLGTVPEFFQINTQTWKEISVGTGHVMAIRIDGTLWVTGGNWDGQLGDGTTSGTYAFNQVGTENTWKHCFAAGGKSMGIKNDGSLWAWGDNNYGHLGIGTNTNVLIPTRVGTDSNWKMVTGDNISTFAIKTDNSLWGWGEMIRRNFTNNTTQSYAPMKLSATNDWEVVYRGSNIIAKKLNGETWCCGLAAILGTGLHPSDDRMNPMIWD